MTILVYTISIALMITFPVALAILLRRRSRVPWMLFFVGILTFAVSQAVHIPLNNFLGDIGFLPAGEASLKTQLLKTALILGATAGICEELSRAAGYAILKRWRKDEHGLMLGLGHGGIEAMAIGGVLTAVTVSSLWGLRGTDLTTLNLSPDQLSALNTQLAAFQGSPLTGFLPLLERMLAVVAHVIFSMLVLRAFQKRNGLYVLGAILYHALMDAGVGYTYYRWNSVAIAHGFLVLLLLPGVIWILRTSKIERSQSSEMRMSFLAEIRAFWLAFKKELMQQWRSRRILVVAIVFLLFGMGSPLLAKYMPEIIKSVAGAEMFAELIPEPSITDAITQYVKNLTQFGFILAILLGMGSIVGEKERGSISIILSKPMPRWAFIASKFAAQCVVYIAAFLVAGMGAYYYSYTLFGPVDLGSFALINLLLLVWLLTFVAMTLVASVIGTSTGAAAGIALALSVMLMLAGNIPSVGIVMPGGLTSWAGSLGSQMGGVTAAETALNMAGGNAGALAAAALIIILGILASLAVFERQEI